jgi:UDP-N-acetyl-D-glucosamine dehydrogenase
MTREHAPLAGRKSVDLTPASIAGFDAVLIATDHDAVDYGGIAKHAKLVVDTRNACGKRGLAGANVVKA